MGLLNGVQVLEAVELESTLITDNPFIAANQAILSYTAIVGGVYTGLKMYVGPGNFNDLIPVFATPSGGKEPKIVPGSSMPTDSVYVYTLSAGDINALGATIDVVGFMVNGVKFDPEYVYSGTQGALVAGNTITFTALPLKADVNFLTFSLI